MDRLTCWITVSQIGFIVTNPPGPLIMEIIELSIACPQVSEVLPLTPRLGLQPPDMGTRVSGVRMRTGGTAMDLSNGIAIGSIRPTKRTVSSSVSAQYGSNTVCRFFYKRTSVVGPLTNGIYRLYVRLNSVLTPYAIPCCTVLNFL